MAVVCWLTVLPRLVTVLPKLVTLVLVAYSCEPFTASFELLNKLPAVTLVILLLPALMPVVLLITTPPTVTWSNTTFGVVATLMLLPVCVMAMLLPALKLTVSPAVICSVVALLLAASVQPFSNSVMAVVCWLTVLVKLVTLVLVAYSCEPLIASVLLAFKRPAATF